MCMPIPRPVGIPIPEEIHEQFPDEVKQAWETFNNWWQEQTTQTDSPKRSDMPAEVREAEEIILNAPIPTMDGPTGRDSCYMVFVQSALQD